MPITHNQAWELSSSKGNGSVFASCAGMQIRWQTEASAAPGTTLSCTKRVSLTFCCDSIFIIFKKYIRAIAWGPSNKLRFFWKIDWFAFYRHLSNYTEIRFWALRDYSVSGYGILFNLKGGGGKPLIKCICGRNAATITHYIVLFLLKVKSES